MYEPQRIKIQQLYATFPVFHVVGFVFSNCRNCKYSLWPVYNHYIISITISISVCNSSLLYVFFSPPFKTVVAVSVSSRLLWKL